MYELYEGRKGWQTGTKHYGRLSKRIRHVAAVSIKQAYFLANNGITFDGNTGVYQDRTCADRPIVKYDGSESWAFDYKHYEGVKCTGEK